MRLEFDWATFVETLVHRSPPYMLEHLKLVLIPLLLALAVAFPVGLLLTRPRYRRYTERVMAVFNAGQTIPPFAIIVIFFPIMGLGVKPAAIALTIYALLPIARNTLAGIYGIPEEVKEAARGMGLSSWQVFRSVELPLCLPVIMTGIKTSAVLTVGTATLAALIGGGGMGTIIFGGINFFRIELIVAGTLGIGLMAVILERLLTLIEYFLTPPHLR